MNNAVLYEKKNATALITLNRPEKRNAINQELITLLFDYLEQAWADESVKALIITGNGKAFCSGVDLSALATDNLIDPRGDGRQMVEVFASCEKPVIGAINGHAITGGFEIALNCDFLLASENAVFIDTHSKLGIHPGWGMSQLLREAVGQRMAKQISLTGEPLTAEKALRCGLVNEVLPADRLMARAFEIADAICSANTPMLMKVKKLIEAANSSPLDYCLDSEHRGFMEYIGRMKNVKAAE